MKGKKSITGSGIFNSNAMHKINRKGKPCIFSQKLNQNLIKYLFDFFYYRELYSLGSINLFFYKCFTDYQLLTWQIEMNNIIDIFHLEINNYEEEVDDTLTKCINKKRTYNMKDHPGCFVRINKEGINFISLAYFDNSVKKELNILNKNNTADKINNNLNLDIINDKLANLNLNKINDYESPNKFNNIETLSLNFSEPPSNLGSADSITTLKFSDSIIWNPKYIEGAYMNNYPSISLIKTAPLNFGFSFYHIIKGDYQIYLNHSLINMKNANLLLQVYINDYNIYTQKNFPSNQLIEQYEGEQNENENNIKLKEYLICSITKKMFEEANANEIFEEQNNNKDYEIRVVFKNQDLFWKAGWCIDGGRLLRKVYEINELNKNSKYKKFKSNNIEVSGMIKYEEEKNIKLKSLNKKKRNSVDNIPDFFS